MIGFPIAAEGVTMALSYAMITPSFRLDRDRCALLVESVQRFVASDVIHYLVVDRRDVSLFRGLVSRRTKILVVEDLLPWWIHRIPGVRRFWWSWRSPPVRNWILQQVVKIAVANAIDQDVLLYVDSDTFFVKAFDPRAMERDGIVPLYVENGQRGVVKRNDGWQNAAGRLLGFSEDRGYDTNFIGNVICWRRGNVLKMQDHLSKLANKSWVLALFGTSVFSEYVCYGRYVLEILKDASGHWLDPLARTQSYWGTTPLGREELVRLHRTVGDHCHSVMVSAKSKTDVRLIREVFFADLGDFHH